MIIMSFVKTREELKQIQKILSNTQYYQMRMLAITFRTTPEFVKAVLPPPLEPDEPTGYAFVGDFAASNCIGPFGGGGVYISCCYNGHKGNYCLSLPMDSEAAVILGRDYFGEPKKMARFYFEKKDNLVTGWTERYGIRFLELEARLNQDLPCPDSPVVRVNYLFKYSHKASGEPGFDLNPVLIRHESHRPITKNQLGAGKLIFRESSYDPIAEIPLIEIGTASYSEGFISTKAWKVADVDPAAFYPYSHSPARYEPWGLMAGLTKLTP